MGFMPVAKEGVNEGTAFTFLLAQEGVNSPAFATTRKHTILTNG